jgi:hypothetical protein
MLKITVHARAFPICPVDGQPLSPQGRCYEQGCRACGFVMRVNVVAWHFQTAGPRDYAFARAHPEMEWSDFVKASVSSAQG